MVGIQCGMQENPRQCWLFWPINGCYPAVNQPLIKIQMSAIFYFCGT